MNGRPPPQPWTESDEWEYYNLGRVQRTPHAFEKATAWQSTADNEKADDPAGFDMLGVDDANYERRKNEANRNAQTADSGRLLRADEQHLRRPLFKNTKAAFDEAMESSFRDRGMT